MKIKVSITKLFPIWYAYAQSPNHHGSFNPNPAVWDLPVPARPLLSLPCNGSEHLQTLSYDDSRIVMNNEHVKEEIGRQDKQNAVMTEKKSATRRAVYEKHLRKPQLLLRIDNGSVNIISGSDVSSSHAVSFH